MDRRTGWGRARCCGRGVEVQRDTVAMCGAEERGAHRSCLVQSSGWPLAPTSSIPQSPCRVHTSSAPWKPTKRTSRPPCAFADQQNTRTADPASGQSNHSSRTTRHIRDPSERERARNSRQQEAVELIERGTYVQRVVACAVGTLRACRVVRVPVVVLVACTEWRLSTALPHALREEGCNVCETLGWLEAGSVLAAKVQLAVCVWQCVELPHLTCSTEQR